MPVELRRSQLTESGLPLSPRRKQRAQSCQAPALHSANSGMQVLLRKSLLTESGLLLESSKSLKSRELVLLSPVSYYIICLH